MTHDDQPYQIMPRPSAEQYEALKNDIRENGQLDPVEYDENGVMIDGHTRHQICSELGIKCKSVEVSGLNEHEKRLRVVSRNLRRRQLTDAQMAMVGRKIQPDIAWRAEQRIKAGTPAADADRGKTVDLVARAVGLGSGDTYSRHLKAIEDAQSNAPDLVSQLEEGALDIRALRAEMNKRNRPADLPTREPLTVDELPTYTEGPGPDVAKRLNTVEVEIRCRYVQMNKQKRIRILNGEEREYPRDGVDVERNYDHQFNHESLDGNAALSDMLRTLFTATYREWSAPEWPNPPKAAPRR